VIQGVLDENQRRKDNGERSLGERGFCLQRERPLLIIHLFRTKTELKAGAASELRLKDPVVTLSFCLPKTELEPQPRTYQVTATYRN